MMMNFKNYYLTQNFNYEANFISTVFSVVL